MGAEGALHGLTVRLRRKEAPAPNKYALDCIFILKHISFGPHAGKG